MGELSKFAQQNSRFLKIEEGQTIRAAFVSFKFAKSYFNPDKDVVSYTLKTSEGNKVWNTSSGKTAEFFDKVKPGQIVSITRHGSGNNTKYDLAIVESGESDEERPEPEPSEGE